MKKFYCLIAMLAVFVVSSCSKPSAVPYLLNQEISRAQDQQRVAKAFSRSCFKSVLWLYPQASQNPMALVQIMGECLQGASQALPQLEGKSDRYAYSLGCVRTYLTVQGLPKNDSQRDAIVAACESTVSFFEGEVQPKPTPSPSSK